MSIDTACRRALAEGFADVALAAGAAIMEIYAPADSPADATAKADGSPLTAADLRAHDAILAGLAGLCPAIPVISEEDAAHRAPEGLARFILVDPLDGTREFVSRNGEFTVNIALVEDGAPVAGVVCAPALGRLWAGAVGQGAWSATWSIASTPPARHAIAARVPPAAGLLAVASRSHRDAATDDFLGGLAVAGLRSVGSSLKFCLLAAGEADVYPRFGPTMEWDTAAGQAVLEAAGGRVLTPEGAPLRYGKPGWRNGPFIGWGAR